MKSFNDYLFFLIAAATVFTVSVCFGGNQELVELKTAELCSINDQMTKQSVPDGLKEGESVEIKAAMRVERSPDKEPIVRDLKVESVKVFKTSDSVETNQAADRPGFRQECLSVPVVN